MIMWLKIVQSPLRDRPDDVSGMITIEILKWPCIQDRILSIFVDVKRLRKGYQRHEANLRDPGTDLMTQQTNFNDVLPRAWFAGKNL